MSNNIRMDNKQVLIISFWNPTAQQPQQGIFIQEQAAAVCKMRENVIFLQVNVLPAGNLILKKTVEESAWYGNRRITLTLSSRLWKFWYVNPWILSKIIFRLIKKKGGEIDPSIIHANVIFPCGVAGYLLARRLGSKLLISEHWSKTGKLLRHPLYKRIAMKAYLYSDAIVCVSEFLSERISKTTGHANMVIIPNIIDTSVYTYLPKPASDSGILRLLCIATWRRPKRLDLIFDAVCSYADESQQNIELTIAGTGPQADSLKNRRTPDNMQVIWAGYLDKRSLAALLHKTHLFLHASDIETFSIVTAEALATGTPVLASNTGALPELINEQNGLLVENTPESWLDAIRKSVTKQYDYKSIASQNKDKYSPEQVGSRLISLYNNLETRLP